MAQSWAQLITFADVYPVFLNSFDWIKDCMLIYLFNFIFSCNVVTQVGSRFIRKYIATLLCCWCLRMLYKLFLYAPYAS
jgi:hypothetical protein